jgi:hypothetical protein
VTEPASVPVEIGWHPDSEQAALAFPPPEPLTEAERAALGPPVAATDALANRLIRIPAAFDARIRITGPGVVPVQFMRIEEEGALTEEAFQGLFTRLEPTAQRRRERPVLQLSLNLFFVTEEPCSLMLMAPFASPAFRDWPGTLVAGRFPARAWPRVLNAALEWDDRGRDWVIRRGESLAYVAFGFDDPAKVPRLVEAATTPALRRQFARVADVVSFGRNVGPMFERAERSRPARLLVAKRTGAQGWD